MNKIEILVLLKNSGGYHDLKFDLVILFIYVKDIFIKNI